MKINLNYKGNWNYFFFFDFYGNYYLLINKYIVFILDICYG